jgi:sialate O-acetylesterase
MKMGEEVCVLKEGNDLYVGNSNGIAKTSSMTSKGNVFCVLALSVTAVFGKTELASVFTDHAVLQRDRPLPVWGVADPGERITVSLGAEITSCTTAADGKWQVELGAQKVSTEPLTLRVVGKESVVRDDILLGDVWLCGGAV